MVEGLVIREQQLQGKAACVGLATEFMDVFKKYGVDVWLVSDIITKQKREELTSPVTDWTVSAKFSFDFSLKRFQECNPLLRLQGLHNSQAEEAPHDCPSTV